MKNHALVAATVTTFALAGCATSTSDSESAASTERFAHQSSALSFETSGALTPETLIEVRVESREGVRQASFRPSDIAHPESAAALAAFNAAIPREVRDAAQQALLARHDARSYVELALVTFDGTTNPPVAHGAGVHPNAMPWAYAAYAACFYGAWAGGGDAVEAGDYCRATYL